VGEQVPTAWSGGRAEEVWSAYYSAVATWVAGLTGDPAVARRVTSEAYVRMFSHWGEEPDPEACLYREALRLVERSQAHAWRTHHGWRSRARLLAAADLPDAVVARVLHRSERAVRLALDAAQVEQLARPRDELGAGADAELQVDVAQVELNGLDAQEELGSDLPVGHAVPNQATHRELLRSKGRGA